MRADEVYHLHTIKGCTSEIISKQTIYLIHSDLSKTVKGSQSKQDEFVTTEMGKKVYEILQALHEPLRKLHPESKNFFHKATDDFGTMNKKSLSGHYQDWFHNIMGDELTITNEDIIDLKISDPQPYLQCW